MKRYRVLARSCRTTSAPAVRQSSEKQPFGEPDRAAARPRCTIAEMHYKGGPIRWVLVISLMLAVVPGLAAPGLAQTIGIVLMHGKTGSPTTVINQLAIALQGAGYLVEAPEMCWSRRRIYDRPFLDCL